MSEKLQPNWKPSPEMLAAYADGELDREDAAALRARIASWIAANPAAETELAANRQLQTLFDRTTPPEPSCETWQHRLRQIETRPALVSESGKRTDMSRWFVSGAAAVACAVWAILLMGHWSRTPLAAPEVFAVATNADVEILHVEGDSVDSLVVGLMPLEGVLNLADPGEVIITSITPARRDNMLPTVHVESRPMIWAKETGTGD